MTEERFLHQIQGSHSNLTTLGSLDRIGAFQHMPPVHNPSVQFNSPSLVSDSVLDGGMADQLYITTNPSLGVGVSPQFLHVNIPTAGSGKFVHY